MKRTKTLLCFGLFSAFAPAQKPVPTPPALSDGNARAIHTAATDEAPSDLDIRFLQYQHEAGKPSATLLAELTAQTRAEREIRRQYREFLGREPGSEEIAPRVYRMSTNQLSAEALTRELRGSEEFYRRSITQAYQDLLGRNPDASGMTTYLECMQRHGWSIERVRADIQQSSEFRRRQG